MDNKDKIKEYYVTRNHVLLNEIFLHSYAVLFSYTMNKVRQQDIALEIIHDTFIIWKSKIENRKTEEINCLSSYAMGILKRQISKHNRLKKRDQQNTTDTYVDEFISALENDLSYS